MKILALITARGGSKGLPRKNLLPLKGTPLITHTINTALANKELIYRTIVSTDDSEIADVSRLAGAEVPFLRPTELATDDATSLAVVRHAIGFVESQEYCELDWVLLLQPTSPLRSAEDISNAIKLAQQEINCSAVISVTPANETHPLKMKIIKNGVIEPYDKENFQEGIRRQDFIPPVFKTNGSIYLTRRDTIMRENSLFGKYPIPLIIPPKRSLDIDDSTDMKMAEILMTEDSRNDDS